MEIVETIGEKEESSEGRSPRALEVERHFLGMSELNAAGRVAKP